MLRFVLLVLASVVAAKRIRSFNRHLDKATACSEATGWNNDMPFSKSVGSSKNVIAIGYKDLGAEDTQTQTQTQTQTSSPDPTVDTSLSQPQSVQSDPIQTPSSNVNDGTTGSGLGSGSEADADSVLLATKTKTKTKSGRSHIMLTCGGCKRTIECTELWTDLLIQSRIDKTTKNIRYLYALRGPDECTGDFAEYNYKLIAQSIFDLLTQDKATQLVAIPHSSGGSTCGKVLWAINALDKAKVLKDQVTLLNLDAGADSFIALKGLSPNFFRSDGFFGYFAKDSDKPSLLSHNYGEADSIQTAHGTKREIDGASDCSTATLIKPVWCEHFALFCKKPPPYAWDKLVTGVDCPKADGSDLESSFLDDIPF